MLILMIYLIGAVLAAGVVVWVGNENLGTYGESASDLSLVIVFWPLVVALLVYLVVCDFLTKEPTTPTRVDDA